VSAVIKLCAAVVQQQVGRDDAEAEPWRLLALDARDEIDQLRRATARAEVERMRERIATQEDGLRHGEQVCARLVTERDEARANLDFLIRSSRADIAVLQKLHSEEIAKLTAAHERDILTIWHEATDAIHPPATAQDVREAVRKLRQERNAANRESACVCLMPTLGHDIQCPARRYKP
jgi:Cdc6-like AAA superfamily ATPase